MAGKNEAPKFIIRSVRPVPFLLSLLQLFLRILVGSVSVVVALVIIMMGLTSYFARTGFEDGINTAEGNKQINVLTIGGNPKSENKLLVVDLSGMILGSAPFPAQDPYIYTLYGVTFGHQLEAQILAAAEDETIKGIFIHTRTPGGTIFGSRAIHDAVQRYQETTKKPVVAWVEGGSYSGGVYSTASATAIYAAPGSQVGSIGVLGSAITYYDDPVAIDNGAGGGVTTRGGVDVEYLSAGEGKDFGNPFRRITERERELAQLSLENLYADFVATVSQGRGISTDKIVNEMGAHSFGNKQAEALGLIDATLTKGEAFGALALLAGLDKDDYAIVRRMPARAGSIDSLVQNSAVSTQKTEKLHFSELPNDIKVQFCAEAVHTPLAFQGSLTDYCGK